MVKKDVLEMDINMSGKHDQTSQYWVKGVWCTYRWQMSFRYEGYRGAFYYYSSVFFLFSANTIYLLHLYLLILFSQKDIWLAEVFPKTDNVSTFSIDSTGTSKIKTKVNSDNKWYHYVKAGIRVTFLFWKTLPKLPIAKSRKLLFIVSLWSTSLPPLFDI